MRLILASASPRRAELLRAAGFDFDVIVADVDESMLAGEAPDHYASRVAQAKARSVFARGALEPVLAADTVVVVDGASLGKPADPSDAARMLRMLSGREHAVVTAVCLMTATGPARARQHGHTARAEAGGPYDGRVHNALARTVVTLAPLNEAEIAWYVGTEESRDKAGAYAVQGLASRFVTRINGSYSNVVGLPVAMVYDLCKQAGLLIC